MDTTFFKLPVIPEDEQTPRVQELLQLLLQMQEEIRLLRDEITRLKKQKTRPKIKPSTMDKEKDSKKGSKDKGSKRRSGKKKKTAELKIHETKICKPDHVPEGSTFNGYENFVVQGLLLQSHNICYRLQQWQTPDGRCVQAKPPESLQGGHYAPRLVSYILSQYYGQHVTQPLLLEQLQDFGIEISSGQLSRILTKKNEVFHQEKEEILSAGIEVSRYLQTDDTGARHQGKNGYCTFVGNDLFSWFRSAERKSRINFLEILRTNHQDYVVNVGALEYMARKNLPAPTVSLLEKRCEVFETAIQWEAHLKELGITGERHLRIATEGALVGSLLAHGFSKEMAILSDDAGQFNVFRHALCWIHAERGINKLIPLNDTHREAIDSTRERLWELYKELKAYKNEPNEKHKKELTARFDKLCATKTNYEALDKAIERLRHNKEELLLVLEMPWLPLHNNLSERDIREYVKRRKISGSTRSELGRQCRDTFTSLKKTCRKHGISFWAYLEDRISQVNRILPLPEIIRLAALPSP